MAVLSSFAETVVEERCIRLVLFVDDPAELDVSTKEMHITSAGRRLIFPLPELVSPTAPLNAAKYFRSTRRLELVLRRPFASSTWKMFEQAEKTMSRVQEEARRLLGPSLDHGFQIDGNISEGNSFSYDLCVDQDKGVVINLQKPGAEECNTKDLYVLGNNKEDEKVFLPWSESVAPCSSSDEDVDDCNPEGRAGQSDSTDARLERQADRRGLRVGDPRIRRTDGQKVKGLSLFTARARRAGELVLYYRGRVLPRNSTSSLPRAHRSRAQRYHFRLDSQWVIDGGTGTEKPRAAHVGALINSPAGCVREDGSELKANLIARIDPSKGLGPRAIQLVAARDIEVDEELLYDYGDQHSLDVVSSDSSSEEL